MYILEDGIAQVIKTSYTNGIPIDREVAMLYSGNYFGEFAISLEEVRTASIVIYSDTAKCLKLSKYVYDEVTNKKQSLLEKNKINLASSIIKSIPFMKALPATVRSKIVAALSIFCFNDGMYICRQGSIGHQLYIIAEGQCKVTINDSENQYEDEIAKLQPGDYFGELALIDPSNKRTANVISIDSVTCLCLSRSDFNSLLKSNEGQMSFFAENAIARHKNKVTHGRSILSHFRRISAFDLHNKKRDDLADNLFKRIGKFMSESLWNSMASRLYRRLILNKQFYEDSGIILKNLIDNSHNRIAFIDSLRSQLKHISDLDSIERTPHDVDLLFIFLNQENDLKSNICRDWPSYMYKELCTKGKIFHFKSLRKIVDNEKRGENIYLVLHGSVRIYSVISQNSIEYQCDIFHVAFE
jgi:CRP-like cAMP-binding protein